MRHFFAARRLQFRNTSAKRVLTVLGLRDAAGLLGAAAAARRRLVARGAVVVLRGAAHHLAPLHPDVTRRRALRSTEAANESE